MGVMVPHFFCDRCTNPVWVRQNVIVPETQDAVALPHQEICSANFLFRSAIVLTAVDLDDEARPVTDEIGDVAPDGHLATKPATPDLTQAEHSPERHFRVRHLTA